MRSSVEEYRAIVGWISSVDSMVIDARRITGQLVDVHHAGVVLRERMVHRVPGTHDR
ncbi:MAG: hypothetical protein GTO67_09920 [Gammaproteobacteria bacterium]|nr:hypothetical protein [Gammaproteobacteria bacterium]NIO25840.1 hypothetical protein [Gammaproteobacteria bacterium]NIO66471.1 hypothetical protein [Gammaproteobacteria bacterium]NIP45649.1 hypothetical protein [Gammaproteobacteria bacterium]NIQ27632.1 hypothetical protein [Gammaproteobacteria bacterium]